MTRTVRIALSLFLLASPTLAQERRLALVIGVSNYADVGSLDRPVDDAWLIADALKKHGKFNVTPVMDPTAASLRLQISDFAAKVREGDAVVVYYAGHAVQAGGRNYILPRDFPNDAAALDRDGVTVAGILEQIAAKKPALKLLILDACRNNPLRGSSPGLAQMEPADYGPGTRIEFAAAAGKVALDGLFAKHLAAELGRPGLELDALFRNVRQAVSTDSNGMQTTFSASQLVVNFFFVAAESNDNDRTLALLERTAAAMPQGELGQTAAVESLLRNRYSLAGTRLLRGVALRSGNFTGGDLSASSLAGTDLSGAILAKANVSKSEMTFATLKGTQFDGAILTGTRLMLADAGCEDPPRTPCASFKNAQAAQTLWFGATARGANFSGADLSGAYLAYADLRAVNFDGANLRGASFVGSDLRGATFTGAMLDNTDFALARLDVDVHAPGACATRSGDSDGALKLTVFERNQDKLEKTLDVYLYLATVWSPSLPACASRQVPPDDRWSPTYSSGGQSSLRTDYALSADTALLARSGLRAAIGERINNFAAWLYPMPSGTFRAVARTMKRPPPFASASAAPEPDTLLRVSGETIEILRQGKRVWQGTFARQTYQVRPDPNAMRVTETAGTALCGTSSEQWSQEWLWVTRTRFAFAQDRLNRGGANTCDARNRILGLEFELVAPGR